MSDIKKHLFFMIYYRNWRFKYCLKLEYVYKIIKHGRKMNVYQLKNMFFHNNLKKNYFRDLISLEKSAISTQMCIQGRNFDHTFLIVLIG